MAKTLKDQNAWQLWLIVALNAVVFWTFTHTEHVDIGSVPNMISSSAKILPAGLAGVASTVLNSLISPLTKAKFVFWRLRDPLPGSRAFSVHALHDPRVNLVRLQSMFVGELPTHPSAQNSAWYRMFRTVENTPSILDAHKDYLFLRDYASLSLLFILFLGGLAWFFINDHYAATYYNIALLGQYAITALAAKNSGVRMVKNVLAIKSADGP